MNAKVLKYSIGIIFLSTGFTLAQHKSETGYDLSQIEWITKDLEAWELKQVNDSAYTKVKNIFLHDYEPKEYYDGNITEFTPKYFQNQEQARKEGCQCDYVKSRERKTCFLRVTQGQGVWLLVYDRDSTGKYIRNQFICIPTWYAIANITFVDIFGNGQKLLLLEHQGDHGTGVNEKVHWILGWHDEGFRTVFWETVKYYCNCMGSLQNYRMQYTIVKGKQPRVLMRCRYDAVNAQMEPYDFHAEWKDWLIWDEKAFSFYKTQFENSKVEIGNFYGCNLCIRRNISQIRNLVLKLQPVPNCPKYECMMEWLKENNISIYSPCSLSTK